MGYVFIGYSSNSKQQADAVHGFLAEKGVESRMAQYGMEKSDFKKETDGALKNCACMLMLFDGKNLSSDDLTAIDCAYSCKKEIIVELVSPKTAVDTEKLLKKILSYTYADTNESNGSLSSAFDDINAGNDLYDKRDYEGAAELYRNAAEQGHSVGQYLLAKCYYHGFGVERDYTRAVAWYRKAAGDGHESAQYMLGECYFTGMGVERDYYQAARWLRTFIKNVQNQAKMYSVTDGVYCTPSTTYKDLYDAQSLLQKCESKILRSKDEIIKRLRAAVRKNPEVQCWLGMCYYYGYYTEIDTSKAVKYLTDAAYNGCPVAQRMIANCYHRGIGVDRDIAEAAKWYAEAAESGDSDAQFSLGTIFYLGKVAERNVDEAKELWIKSAEQGNESAKLMLREKFDIII